LLTWFQTADRWFSNFDKAIHKDSPSLQSLCFIVKKDYHDINENGSIIIESSVFIQKWIETTEVPMTSSSDKIPIPERKKKHKILLNYLCTLNEHMLPGDFDPDPEPQNHDQASSSKSKTQA
jgi:hypothetical protein